MNSDLDFWIKTVLAEVERDLDLPANSLVDGTPLPKTRRVEGLKSLEVRLDKNFLSKVGDQKIAHSKFLRLLKELAIKDQIIEDQC